MKQGQVGIRGEKFYKVINIKNQGVYIIGENKLRKEPTRWELFVEQEEDDDLSYIELKKELRAKGIGFKGNAKKEELLKLLEED